MGNNQNPLSNEEYFGHPVDDLSSLFRSISPADVEQFSTIYQRWQLQQHIEALQAQATIIRQQLSENTAQMEAIHPSPIALATLARLQSNGVSDLNLLDRMLERGDTWLDHTLQLLEYCEQLDFIQDDYTQWCEHALEGAYDWVESISDPTEASLPEEPSLQEEEAPISNPDMTEALLLQKLMSEDETLKIAAITLPQSEQEPAPENRVEVLAPPPSTELNSTSAEIAEENEDEDEEPKPEVEEVTLTDEAEIAETTETIETTAEPFPTILEATVAETIVATPETPVEEPKRVITVPLPELPLEDSEETELATATPVISEIEAVAPVEDTLPPIDDEPVDDVSEVVEQPEIDTIDTEVSLIALPDDTLIEDAPVPSETQEAAEEITESPIVTPSVALIEHREELPARRPGFLRRFFAWLFPSSVS